MIQIIGFLILSYRYTYTYMCLHLYAIHSYTPFTNIHTHKTINVVASNLYWNSINARGNIHHYTYNRNIRTTNYNAYLPTKKRNEYLLITNYQTTRRVNKTVQQECVVKLVLGLHLFLLFVENWEWIKRISFPTIHHNIIVHICL